VKRTPMPPRAQPIRRVNRKRRRSEFARCYHSEARKRFVQSLPCCACGVVGYSENAHVTDDGTKGAGRKSGYRCIAPLCGRRPVIAVNGLGETLDYGTVRGCHRWSHADADSFLAVWKLDMDAEAAKCEAKWQATHPERKADA